MLPSVGLWRVIVVFPGHTYLPFDANSVILLGYLFFSVQLKQMIFLQLKYNAQKTTFVVIGALRVNRWNQLYSWICFYRAYNSVVGLKDKNYFLECLWSFSVLLNLSEMFIFCTFHTFYVPLYHNNLLLTVYLSLHVMSNLPSLNGQMN